MEVTRVEQPKTAQWEYLLLEVVPWLDGWQYIPLDDRGLPLDQKQRMELRIDGDVLNPPGLNAFGDRGWEVAGIVPEMHLYHHGRAYHSSQKTVLLLKRRKP